MWFLNHAAEPRGVGFGTRPCAGRGLTGARRLSQEEEEDGPPPLSPGAGAAGAPRSWSLRGPFAFRAEVQERVSSRGRRSCVSRGRRCMCKKETPHARVMAAERRSPAATHRVATCDALAPAKGKTYSLDSRLARDICFSSSFSFAHARGVSRRASARARPPAEGATSSTTINPRSLPFS